MLPEVLGVSQPSVKNLYADVPNIPCVTAFARTKVSAVFRRLILGVRRVRGFDVLERVLRAMPSAKASGVNQGLVQFQVLQAYPRSSSSSPFSFERIG